MDEDREERRHTKITEMFADKVVLPAKEKKRFLEFLSESHKAFSLEEGERGETDKVQLHIDTGDAPPRKQYPRRMPFSTRKAVAQHIEKMEKAGVIQPSNSSWASPIVLVCKKDGTHRFCVDYRSLNSVTKADTFPLPRIDDLLDQVSGAKYFSTLDLSSGYWQVKVHPDSQQKTAFVTHCGLHEFRVMPFGLKNAPAVFQRLLQEVLAGLNEAEESDFVSR